MAGNDEAETDEDTAISIDVLVNDSDIDGDVSIESVDSVTGSGAALAIVDGAVTYDPSGAFDSLAPGDSEEDSFGYVVTDGVANDTGSVTVTVTGVNDAPTADALASTGNADETQTVTPTGDDIDEGDEISFALGSVPEGLNVTIDDEENFVFDPDGSFDNLAAGEETTVEIGYTATDTNDATTSATWTITIIGVNEAPVAGNDEAETDEDTAISIDVLVNDSDIDGDVVSVESVDDESIGAASVDETGLITYDPAGAFDSLAPGETAEDTFEYTTTDGGLTDTALVTVTVTGVNDAPIADDDEYEIDVLGPITLGNALDNDSDIDNGDFVTVTALDLTGTTGSVLSNGDGTFEYTRADLLVDGATDSFVYEITDQNGASTTATVTISEVDVDNDGFGVTADCNDDDDTIYPGADEVPYDGIDQNCDDEDLVDVDGDGFASVNVPDGTDCNDDDDTIYPGADEVPYDGIDQNCDDEDLVDVDGDGFASVNVPDGTDCDDDNPDIYPGSGCEDDGDGFSLSLGIDYDTLRS